MTEKRFTSKASDWISCDIFDKEIEIANVHRDDAQGLCNLLNEQHETIQQLQHDASILIQANQDYRVENEQLKQQLIEKERMLDVRDKIIADVMKAVNGDVE